MKDTFTVSILYKDGNRTTEEWDRVTIATLQTDTHLLPEDVVWVELVESRPDKPCAGFGPGLLSCLRGR